MGGKSGGSQTIGYSYYMTLQMGLCRGPIDELVQVNVGDVHAWPVADGDSEQISGMICIAEGPEGNGSAQYEDGTAAVVPAAQINTARFALADVNGIGERTINAPKLFGGDKKEGGIQGLMTLCWGKAAQIIPATLAALMGGRVPAFRGVATLFYDGLLCSLNPYPKTWTFRVRRTTNGWDGAVWQPDLAAIWMRGGTIKAMNGAHIIYECLTNRDWGRGYPRAALSEANFLRTAQRLHAENFGLCLRWTRSSELGAFIQTVVDHIGATMYVDPATGLICLDLLRNSGNIDPEPVFTYDTGLLSVEDDETASPNDITNEMVVDWNDPIFDKERQSRVHNLASIQANGGGKNNSKVSYSGIPTSDLALRIAQRDLIASANSIRRYKVRFDRRAWEMSPGKKFRVVAPDRQMNRSLRAGKVRHETDGSISVIAALDVFTMPNTSHVSTESGAWVQPSRTPENISRRKIMEGSYRDLLLTIGPGDLATVTTDQTAITAMAAKPTILSQGFTIMSRVGTEAFEGRGTGSFVSYGETDGTVGPHATTFAVNGVIEGGLIKVGNAVHIGNELCRLEAITLNAISTDLGNGILATTGTVTLLRGCGDTVPQTHGPGTQIFFRRGIPPHDEREYVTGETVNVKLLPFTSTSELPAALAVTETITLVGRQGRPYPPANVRINGTPFGQTGTLSAPITISWAHRNRLTIKDRMIGHGQASTDMEEGATYTIRVYSPGVATPLRTVTGLSGNNWIYTAAMIATDGIGTSMVFELESVREGLTSFQRYRFTVART